MLSITILRGMVPGRVQDSNCSLTVLISRVDVVMVYQFLERLIAGLDIILNNWYNNVTNRC